MHQVLQQFFHAFILYLVLEISKRKIGKEDEMTHYTTSEMLLVVTRLSVTI